MATLYRPPAPDPAGHRHADLIGTIKPCTYTAVVLFDEVEGFWKTKCHYCGTTMTFIPRSMLRQNSERARYRYAS